MEIGAIILAAVGSAGLFNLVQFLIARKDKKKDALEEIRNDVKEIKKEQRKLEKDLCRTQMLLLMAEYPQRQEEMLKISQHYFSVLLGDWYMTTLFADWLERHHMKPPMWFDMNTLKGEMRDDKLE